VRQSALETAGWDGERALGGGDASLSRRVEGCGVNECPSVLKVNGSSKRKKARRVGSCMLKYGSGMRVS
jgi:hypothetical protein